ncbi:MAG TPA: ABC transporter permease, partial [Gemmatimonadales bacterium]
MLRLRTDLAYAARSLRKSPSFTATALITIALGIGATTSIFSVVQTVLLRPLPYPDASKLVYVTSDMTARNVNDFPMPPSDFGDLRERGSLFESVAAVSTFRGPLLADDGSPPERIAGAAATPGLFGILGMKTVLGRTFIEDDATPVPPPAPVTAGTAAPAPPPGKAVLSYEYWHRRFGGDRGVLGKIIRFGGGSTEVVGVLEPNTELLFPPSFGVERRPDVWVALRVNFGDTSTASRINVFLRFVGRLKPEVSASQAQGQVDGIVADLKSRFSIKQSAGLRWRVEPMHDYMVAGVKPGILALMGAVVFVLLIACANVANLLLVRAAARERELTVRSALGAGRTDLIGQMLAESLLLAGGGAVLGIALAFGATTLLKSMAPPTLPRVDLIGMNLPVLAFAILAALGAAVIFGLVPALRASRPDAGAVLRNSGRTAGLAAGKGLRNTVVVVEVALSFVLLVGSGLMIRSFVALQKVDPGYDARGLLTFLAGPPNNLRAAAQRAAWMRDLRGRLEVLPGVTAVSGASPLPLDGGTANARWGTADAAADPAKFRQADVHIVQPGYFRIMKTRLLEGRLLDDDDNVDTARAVMIIDRLFAARAFPGRSAVGQRLLVRVRSSVPEWIDIVGVVEHQRSNSIAEEGREALYVTDAFAFFGAAARWIVRTGGTPMDLAPAVRGEVARFAPTVPVSELQPMTDLVDRSTAPTRFALVLIGSFAVIAAMLAAVGLYGVLATAVRQRTAEIGIRMTFGAPSGGIFKMIIGQGMMLCAGGIGAGLLAAFLLTRLMST